MTQSDPHFEALLAYLKESRGFDFTGYKRASLMRRVDRRMQQVEVTGYANYVDYLQVHPDEFTALFNTILINVTGFFRDPEAWAHLGEEVLPGLLAGKDPDAQIRIWSAGCASGEEAYTLAMVIAEAIGRDDFARRVKIYATDVDEEELVHARLGSYTERQLNGVPSRLVDLYFDLVGGRYVFRKDLRRSIIFGRNDLVQDAPISRVDLLVCRNALMYFNAETQARILSRFHFALTPGGVLFLGKAEMLLTHGTLFAPVDLKRRIFRKTAVAAPGNPGLAAQQPLVASHADLFGLDRLRDEAFMTAPMAQIVVTPDGLVALTNRLAEVAFGVSARDVGRPFRDLDLSYRPVELRGYIDQAQVERRTVRVPELEYTGDPGDKPLFLDVLVTPLIDNDSSLLGVALSFHDTTTARRLREDLDLANRQAETAHEELQSTNEELETTNEELQSSVEELETTNEELQSTNEELETMNEELQSTNDELQSINHQLRDRTAELDNANAFLSAILTSLRAGVAVIDAGMHVRAWNRRAEDLWGLREEEALGEHFLNLDIGLPTEQLRPLVRKVLAGGPAGDYIVAEAINRRGRTITVRVACSPLANQKDGTTGAILVMEVEDTAAV